MGYIDLKYEDVIIRIEDNKKDSINGVEKEVAFKSTVITSEMLEKSLKPIMKFGKKIVDEFSELQPDEVSLSLGLDIGLETGGLYWGIVKGTTNSNLSINMKWKKHQ